MSNYKLCKSSEKLLHNCIEKAAPLNTSNKWVLQFDHKRQFAEEINIIIIDNDSENQQEEVNPIFDAKKDTVVDNSSLKTDDDFLELLELDPISNFDCMVQECLKNKNLIIDICDKLSTNAIEKLSTHIFGSNSVNYDFVKSFYESFLPMYLKRDYSWFSLDLLVKSSTYNEKLFDKLTILLIKSVDIPNKVLEDFFQTLNEANKKLLLFKIMEIDLNLEQFSHNLFLIYTAYKQVKVDCKIQNFIYKNIIQFGPNCKTEKTFGRLLLTFLQHQNNIGIIKDYDKVERIVENHCTPFKKPCINCLKENTEKYRI